jgi:hypothetical protein
MRDQPRRRRRTGAKLARFVHRLVAFQKDHPSMSFAAIARRFHVTPGCVGPIFKRAGCKTPFPPKTRKPPQIGMYSHVTADQMLQAFQELGSSKRVASRFHLTRSYVNQVLSTAGCRTKRRPREVDWKKIKSLYEGGIAILEIARQFKIGHKRVRRELAERGVTIRPNTAWLIGWHEARRAAVAEVKSGRTRPDLADLKKKPKDWQTIVPVLLAHTDWTNAQVLEHAGISVSKTNLWRMRDAYHVPGPRGRPAQNV